MQCSWYLCYSWWGKYNPNFEDTKDTKRHKTLSALWFGEVSQNQRGHSFVQHCQKQNICEAYCLTVREKMVSPAICEDTKPTGKYWIKLASGANNMVFEEKRRLSDDFLDEDIEIIIKNLAYNTEGQTQCNGFLMFGLLLMVDPVPVDNFLFGWLQSALGWFYLLDISCYLDIITINHSLHFNS
jgi:hypothetical protein